MNTEWWEEGYTNVSGTFTFTSDTLTITEADISSLSINNYGSNSDYLEVGTTIAGEVTLRLENSNSRFSSYNFVGAELSLTISKGNSTVTFPTYWIDTVDFITGFIDIKGLDVLGQLDVVATDFQSLMYEKVGSELANISYVFEIVTEKFGIAYTDEIDYEELYFDYTLLANYTFTWRQLVGWCASAILACVYARVNSGTNEICTDWYKINLLADETNAVVGLAIAGESKIGTDLLGSTTGANGDTLDKSVIYTSKVENEDVQITGITVVYNKDESYTYGSSGYLLQIRENPLVNAIISNYGIIYYVQYTLATRLNQILPYSYRPFQMTTLQLPETNLFDIFAYVHEGEACILPVTDWTWVLNGATSIRGRGSNATDKTYNDIYQSTYLSNTLGNVSELTYTVVQTF